MRVDISLTSSEFVKKLSMKRFPMMSSEELFEAFLIVIAVRSRPISSSVRSRRLLSKSISVSLSNSTTPSPLPVTPGI